MVSDTKGLDRVVALTVLEPAGGVLMICAVRTDA